MRFGVAMIANIFYPSIGGAQVHTLRLSQKLRARDIDVVVVTRYHTGLARYEEVSGVPTYRVGAGAGPKALSALSFSQGAVRLLYTLRNRYDIIHCHQMVSPMTIGLLAQALVHKPLVVNPHARGVIGDIAVLTQRRPITGRIRLAAAKQRGDAFVSISDDIGDELRGVGVAPQKLWSIPNGVDLDHFTPSAPEARSMLREQLQLPQAPTVLFTGRLAQVKALDVLLNAWPLVRQQVPGARLLVLGDGEERAALEAQAKRLGVAESVTFYGSTADVAPFLRAADAYVLCSRSEGLPVALLEAMASGLPIVATNVGGMAQVLEDGVTGRLVPVEDAPALASGLAEALSSPAASNWGEQGRKHVAAHFSLDAVAEQYIAMYEVLLQRRGSRQLASDQAPL